MTTRVIRIDQEVWTEIQKRAHGFGDKPNKVLRRVFALDPPAQVCNRLHEGISGPEEAK